MSRMFCRNLNLAYHQVRFNSNRTSIAKIGREKYCRMYPTKIVNADGSTYTVRYHEPRKIIKLPLYTLDLTPEELQRHIERKKPKEKIVIEEQLEDDFDLNRYQHLWKPKDS